MISGLKCFHNFTDNEASDCHHLINKTWILNNRIIIAKTEYICVHLQIHVKLHGYNTSLSQDDYCQREKVTFP